VVFCIYSFWSDIDDAKADEILAASWRSEIGHHRTDIHVGHLEKKKTVGILMMNRNQRWILRMVF
jgi:hypothetical protein